MDVREMNATIKQTSRHFQKRPKSRQQFALNK